MNKERVEYLLLGAEQEMVHGDYLPNIPERIELCRAYLQLKEAEDKLKIAVAALKSCVETLGYQDPYPDTMTDKALKKAREALEKLTKEKK